MVYDVNVWYEYIWLWMGMTATRTEWGEVIVDGDEDGGGKEGRRFRHWFNLAGGKGGVD